MKAISSAVVSAALAIGMAAPASAAQGGPETILYRVPGVVDSGEAANIGVATVFACTNFSGVTENVRFVTRHVDGSLVSNFATTVDHLATLVASTHFVHAMGSNNLAAGFVFGGTTAIAATSINIICTALIIDAASSLPHGVALRAIRFNPVPGSQE